MIDRADPASMACSTGGIEIIPVRGMHDKLPVLGFRFGQIAYLTDFSSIPESEFPKLEGLEHVTLNTVGYHPHHSHFSLDEALELANRIGAKHTWLTHLSHAFPQHEKFCADLLKICTERGINSIVQPAYDGLTITT
jgi:phosphoribosyl 1,2-cyclic phosphate phosphodiesterase